LLEPVPASEGSRLSILPPYQIQIGWLLRSGSMLDALIVLVTLLIFLIFVGFTLACEHL
jgi:hypothetical protein